jgi:hypothetical protein
MNHSSHNSQDDPNANHGVPNASAKLWQRIKSDKRVSYLALPLIIMATLSEIVILATGWKYQQMVCIPSGMGVTFLGIGPIGATILAVEALKLPLAIWTASRVGWQKSFMLVVGLPLICVLTFQLVKDMAVYEMEVAMRPASELLEKASAEEIKIKQLNGELAAIEGKKLNRGEKLAELTEQKAKTKAELDEVLKRNEAIKQEAITLTDYQKKELSEVEIRQSNINRQFNADAEKLTKALADLRARREVEVGRASKWNVEEARIDNEYKAKLAAYTNQKTAYEKDLAEYNSANILRRQLMKEPIDPGVPPVRESNKVLKSADLVELDSEIKTKEAELLAINNKRRSAVAQVDADARQLRADFDSRSRVKREEADRKREELLAASATLMTQLAANEKQINEEYLTAAKRVDGIRAEIDSSRKSAESHYEAREAAIQGTQVHRIATTVEIVRGLFTGKRPVSITASAKERGDIYTDQISMVRIWVYPVLAFIVAFLPTLMVELGFSTLFQRQSERPAHRLGFLGRRMHWLYTRAGRLKILRAERRAHEAAGQIAAREHQIAAVKAEASSALAEKDAGLEAARQKLIAASAEHEAHLKQKESEWVGKFTGVADALNRATTESEQLRDLQKAEIERQVGLRQKAWSDRVTQLQKDLDEEHAASETERAGLMEDHRRKLQVVSDDCKSQIIQIRRQLAEVEFAADERIARAAAEQKEATQAREIAESQLRHQSENLSLQLAQAREEGMREVDKAARQEKQRLERQLAELEKALRQREEEFVHQLKQHEQETAIAFESKFAEQRSRTEQDLRRREAELEREFEVRAREAEGRWLQELQQRDDAAQIKLRQREQQLVAQADARMNEVQLKTGQELGYRQSEFERQLNAQAREVENRLRQEMQQAELAFHTKLKQREQDLIARAAARENELQNQWVADQRAREEEWERQVEGRIRAGEARLAQEAQQKEEIFQIKLRQREQQLQSQSEARQTELQAQWDQDMRNREHEWAHNADARARATEARMMAEMQQKEESFQSKLRQRDQQWQVRLDTARVEMKAQTEQDMRTREAEGAEAQARALADVESRLRREMLAKEDLAQAEAKSRDEGFVARLDAQAEASRMLQQERDEARNAAAEAASQVRELKKKLMDASSFLSGWKTGNGNGNGDGASQGNTNVGGAGHTGARI